MSNLVASDNPGTAGASTTATGSRAAVTMDRIKTGATVLGAIAGALTGLWGFYEKVRAEARHDTAASYNTLAPQVNQLGEALKQLQLENQQLRNVVAEQQKTPRLAQVPRRAEKPRSAAAPAAPDPSSAPAAPATPTPPATPATAGAPAGQPATAEAPPAATPEGDTISGLLQTVGRTRAVIEDLRKVPDDFGHVLEKQKR
jgi:hypothetical protein